METGTILIVDDNKSVLASLELLLENEFSTVRTAANPNQITTLLTTTSIDCIFRCGSTPYDCGDYSYNKYCIQPNVYAFFSLHIIFLSLILFAKSVLADGFYKRS